MQVKPQYSSKLVFKVKFLSDIKALVKITFLPHFY